jgi:hypothetical protein
MAGSLALEQCWKGNCQHSLHNNYQSSLHDWQCSFCQLMSSVADNQEFIEMHG